jgi:hypothetical protein
MLATEVHISIPTNIPALVNAVEADIEAWQQELAYRIPEEARRLMDESTPTGRVYRRGTIRNRRTQAGIDAGLRGSGKTRMITGVRFHRASAKGQAPAEDTGRLYRDISVRRMARGNYRVRFGAPYAGFLELALDRPFILPAIEAAVKRTFSESKIFQ